MFAFHFSTSLANTVSKWLEAFSKPSRKSLMSVKSSHTWTAVTLCPPCWRIVFWNNNPERLDFQIGVLLSVGLVVNMLYSWLVARKSMGRCMSPATISPWP